jgi:hypothetical protein
VVIPTQRLKKNMTFKRLKILILVSVTLCSQLLVSSSAAQETITAEEFISGLRESGDIGIFDHPSVALFKSTCTNMSTPIPGQELNAFCEVIVNSPVCSEVEEGDRLNCTDMDESRDFNALEFIRGCTTGFADGVMDVLNFAWDVLGWVWDTIRSPVEAVQEGWEYIESARLYLVNEYDQAYEEASSPFRSLKAAKEVLGSIFNLLLNSIQDFLQREYQEFGCMNFEARTNTMCKVMTEIIVPPASAFYLIKGAYNLVKRPRSLRAFMRSERSGPRRFEQEDLAESALRRDLDDIELEAIDRAHFVGRGEVGLDGGPAGIGNYTLAQLRRKAEILKEANLDSQDIRTLMEEGVVGISGDGLGRLFGRTPPAPLRLERNSGSPEMDEFREAFNSGNFTGESSYISYNLTSTIREPVRVIRREGDNLVVERKNGEVFNLNADQVTTARTSSSAMEEFGLARSVGEVRYTLGERVMIPRSNGGSSAGEIMNIFDDGRARVSFTENGVPYEKVVNLSSLRRLNPMNIELPGDSRPAFNSFRQAFNANDFTGENRFVSFMELDERVAAKVVGVDRHGLRLEVAGSIPIREVVVRDLSELNNVKLSSTAKEFYANPPKPEVSRRLATRQAPEMNRSPDELLSANGAANLEVQMSNGRHYQAEVISRQANGQVEVRLFRDGEFHSTATLDSNILRPYTPRSGQYNVQSLINDFRNRVGEPTYTTADGGSKSYNFSSGNVFFTHYRSDISVARAQGRVFDNIAPSELPPGNYTYVITETGEVSFGLVTDGLEFGVKHVHIAQGRRIAVAGEVRVGANRELTYNELSGTFTSEAIKNANKAGRTGYASELNDLARRFFDRDPNSSGVTRVGETVFPNEQPSANDIRRMCAYLLQTSAQVGDSRIDELRRINVCQ